MIYLDTSAFLKLYILEPESEFVQNTVQSQYDPLPVWDFQQFEMTNVFRLKVFWGELTDQQADHQIEFFDQRLQRGQYYYPDIHRGELMHAFRALSQETSRLGCRTMDILHVACAQVLAPDAFVSFDERQCQLARHAGLTVLPASLPLS